MFVDFFIRRPIFATVCALLIILAGAVTIPTLPVAQFPDLAPPQVGVGVAVRLQLSTPQLPHQPGCMHEDQISQ